MTVEEQGEKLINESWQFAPSSGGTRERIAIDIAIWCVNNIISNLDFSVNDEYWINVLKYLKNK